MQTRKKNMEKYCCLKKQAVTVKITVLQLNSSSVNMSAVFIVITTQVSSCFWAQLTLLPTLLAALKLWMCLTFNLSRAHEIHGASKEERTFYLFLNKKNKQKKPKTGQSNSATRSKMYIGNII